MIIKTKKIYENFTDENARSIIYKSLFAITRLIALGILRVTVRRFLPSHDITSTVSRIESDQ
jgi:hypothetical protein